MPSLKQLVDAVAAFMEEHPTDLITVVVDATFGHRIDPREVAEFDAAIEHNEIVAPPAGAVGRGDAFVLAIANKVNATIISNDSYQEFHADYDWLFDEGRLIGGKPVPHVGWVFVPRVPVRGPLSRKVTRDAKRKDRPAAAPVRSSREALRPMPVPSAPPPGARVGGRGGRRGRAEAPAADTAAAAEFETAPTPRAATPAAAKSTQVPTPAKSAMVNDVLPFLAFVEHHPVGSVVEGVVESYASHGAYVTIGDARGYVPLRLMSEPQPRSAREAMKIGDTVTLHVAAFHGSRRGIDLSTPAMAGSIAPTQAEADDEAGDQPTVSDAARKRRGKPRPPRGAPAEATDAAVPVAAEPAAAGDVEPAAPAKRGRKKAAAPAAAAPVAEPTPAPAPAEPATAKRARKAAAPAPAASVVAVPAEPATPAKRARKAAAPAPAPVEVAPAPPAPAKKAAKKSAGKAAAKPTKKAAAPAAAVAPAPAPAPAKKAAARKKAAPSGS